MSFQTEQMLVNGLIQHYITKNCISSGCMIIPEAKSTWGVVDVLVIKYDKDIYAQRRKRIGRKRLKALSNLAAYALAHIYEKRKVSSEQLASYLKLRNGTLLNILHQLKERHLVDVHDNGFIYSKQKAKNYFVKDICAFEVKLSKWRRVIVQAERHLWFTNSSYIVLPSLSDSVLTKVLSVCSETGIGFVVVDKNGSFKTIKEPLHREHIDSYFAWKLNEALLDGSLANATRAIG